MTTLEKVAKAILDSVLDDSSGPGKISSAGTEVRVSGEVQFDSRRVARAALEALKGSNVFDRAWQKMESMNDNWNNALDAILNEKEG